MPVKTCILAAILTAAAVLPARAERGVASSPASNLDARAPRLSFLVPEGDETWRSGEQLSFCWSLDEAHLNTVPSRNMVRVLSRDEELYAHNFKPIVGTNILTWYAPDISSGDCRLRLEVADRFGNATTAESPPFTLLGSTTGVPARRHDHLAPPRPNPFNPSTEIGFSLAGDGPARLAVFDLRGRRVRTLLDGPLPAGRGLLSWDGRDDDGRRLPAGTYLLRLRAPSGASLSRKAVMAP